MNARLRSFAVTMSGGLAALLGYLWFASDPLGGLTVAVSGAVALGWGAHRLVFDH